MQEEQEKFPKDVRSETLQRANYRCERCWSQRDLGFYQISHNGGVNDAKNCVVLCSRCRKEAPDDSFLFEYVFMRFSSPKEMIRHYNAKTEEEALELLSKEVGIEGLQKSAISSGTVGQVGLHRQSEKRYRSARFVPYGYRFDGEKLIVEESEAKAVRKIFRMCKEGSSTREIANHLNNMEIHPPNSPNWSKQTIAGILKNPTYCGFLKDGGKLRKGSHPAIIRVSEYNKVQQELTERIRQAHQKHRPLLLPED